jgi:GTP-binding protein YchF
MNFVDIAGLVKGASKGEGLGNQFLATIREVDAVAYVLRCFEDDDITHVSGKIDPLSDFEVVETELMLADMDSLEKRRLNVEKKAKGGDKESIQTLELLKLALEQLNAGKPARRAKIAAEDVKAWKMLQLLTSKPVFYICNVDEASAGTGNNFSDAVVAHAKAEGSAAVVISAKIESETAVLSDDEQKEFLDSLGLEEPGLNRVIRAGYELLGLQTYFTVGPKEARAWTIKKGTTAPQAAGVIHGDFEKGFIKAETIAYDDFVKFKGESGAKEAGKARQEGKEYIVQDGDVMHFRFNV